MLRELFAKNRNIVINTDIDGILSGIILCKYCDCNIVGFTNSKDSVWLADGYDNLYTNVYIDMFVTNKDTVCIDQHIIAVNNEHMQQIRNSKTKFSPHSDDENNLRVFNSDGFKNKYPFGTVLYLIAQLESEGYVVSLPDLNSAVPNSEIKLGDLILRADDAMRTSLYAYKSNADFWWNWLEEKAQGECIKAIRRYLDSLGAKADALVNARPVVTGRRHLKKEYENERSVMVYNIKEKTKKYFVNEFLCKTSDGAFDNIADDNGCIFSFVEKYIITIATLFEVNDITIPKHYNKHTGTAYRTRWLPVFQENLLKYYSICGHKVFSYAFIYGPENESRTNFSLTIDMV